MHIDRQLEILTQQVVRSRIFYDIWWLYKGSNTRPKIIDAMNDFSEFYRFDEHAHFVSLIIHCVVLWDKGAGNVSILSLARKVLDPKRNGADKELYEKVTQLEKSAKGIITLRHEAIAHRSAVFDYDEAFRRARISPNSIRDMTSQALAYVNELRVRRSMPEAFFTELPLVHAKALIRAVGGPDLNQPDIG